MPRNVSAAIRLSQLKILLAGYGIRWMEILTLPSYVRRWPERRVRQAPRFTATPLLQALHNVRMIAGLCIQITEILTAKLWSMPAAIG